MKRLPIGRSDFETIRTEGFLYVDKTKDIHNLLIGGGRYFLSRPRRFGKSLTISTLDSIFQGRVDLFEGLWIFDKIDWQPYPVLRFSFDKLSEKGETIQSLLRKQFYVKAAEHDLHLEENSSLKGLFSELILKLAAKKGKIVVLVDEYDKPMLDVLPHNPALAASNRDVLKEFFETIKSEDKYVHFVFVTGVSKFAKISLFSGPNQLEDISLSPDFSTLCGYTQAQLVQHFSDSFPAIAKKQEIKKSELLPLIKEWYNGYSWRGESVYNPWSILRMVKDKSISNYWFLSGSPSFLLRYLKEGLYYDVNDLTVQEGTLEGFGMPHVDYRALLFQSGYLTILSENIQDRTLVLGFPNKEVELSLSQYM